MAENPRVATGYEQRTIDRYTVIQSNDSTPDRRFSEMELREYNGERGRSVYIACDGVVYDVSDAPNWRSGMHRAMHYAGLDLTRSLRKAPHDASVFHRVRRVGILVEGS